MNPVSGALLAAVFLTSALATGILARVAPRLGWTDAPRGFDAARKLQRRAVPSVGGAAILCALFLAPELPWQDGAPAPWPWPGPPWSALALACVFVAGTVDDRWSLRPGPKSVLQLAALAPLGVGVVETQGSLAGALGLVALGFLALNLLNTFDNADGAVASLSAAGFLAAQPYVAAACLGFLPFNLDASRARNRASAAPSAYLGDAGSFALAFLILATPRACGILWLPLLDLLRLSAVRLRAGSRPWIGDRRHLAHRLLARGLARPAVAGLQVLLALPACALVPRAVDTGETRWAALGLACTAALFLLALRWSGSASGGRSEREEGAVPCPGRSPPE